MYIVTKEMKLNKTQQNAMFYVGYVQVFSNIDDANRYAYLQNYSLDNTEAHYIIVQMPVQGAK